MLALSVSPDSAAYLRGDQGTGGEKTGLLEPTTCMAQSEMVPMFLKGGIYLPPDSDDLGAERGRSDSDRRHRLVLAAEGRLPWWGLRVSGVLEMATGSPFNVTTGGDENQDGIPTDRPAGLGRNTGADTPLDSVNALRAERGLAPLNNLELFPQSPNLTLETYQAMGRNAARYAKNLAPIPVGVKVDNWARLRLIVKTALLHRRETEEVRDQPPAELLFDWEPDV